MTNLTSPAAILLITASSSFLIRRGELVSEASIHSAMLLCLRLFRGLCQCACANTESPKNLEEILEI